jgi:hypothetical protein
MYARRPQPWIFGLFIVCGVLAQASARAGAAPAWMHALVDAALPPHDVQTPAVELYSESVLSVDSYGRITRFQRSAYKILRPEGEKVGTVQLVVDAQTRVTDLHAWSIPATGKDYEVTERDAIDLSLDVPMGELAGDLHLKKLKIPAATPGSIVGFEWRQEVRPYLLQDQWRFQSGIPVREAIYRLELPPGWSYQSSWVNHSTDAPSLAGPGKMQWVVDNVTAIVEERRMPPEEGVAGALFIALLPPGGQYSGPQSWADLGSWYGQLTQGRRDASPQLRQKVADLTSSAPTQIAKIRALAEFVQNDVRYVAVELGIGGYQPHTAAEILAHSYGDCKDKVTLLSAMLAEIGVDSYYVIINTQRDAVTAATPPHNAFNHVIIAIALPKDADDAILPARMLHPTLGSMLYFDPTDDLTAFGNLRGVLQENYALLVTPKSGELVRLPRLAASLNSLDRTAQLSLDEQGTLRGEVHENWTGDLATTQRTALRTARLDTDQIKPVEARIGASLTQCQVLKASVTNLRVLDKPFGWNFTIEAQNYARPAGDLLLIRPRVLGSATSDLTDSTEERHYPIEFAQTERETDHFDITVPVGYSVDELPPAVHAETSFGSYDSKTEMSAGVLRYTRSYEIRELRVPPEKLAELKQFYRLIARDERASAVFKRSSQ